MVSILKQYIHSAYRRYLLKRKDGEGGDLKILFTSCCIKGGSAKDDEGIQWLLKKLKGRGRVVCDCENSFRLSPGSFSWLYDIDEFVSAAMNLEYLDSTYYILVETLPRVYRKADDRLVEAGTDAVLVPVDPEKQFYYPMLHPMNIAFRMKGRSPFYNFGDEWMDNYLIEMISKFRQMEVDDKGVFDLETGLPAVEGETSSCLLWFSRNGKSVQFTNFTREGWMLASTAKERLLQRVRESPSRAIKIGGRFYDEKCILDPKFKISGRVIYGLDKVEISYSSPYLETADVWYDFRMKFGGVLGYAGEKNIILREKP